MSFTSCNWIFLEIIVIFFYLQGVACFFVKHVQTGMCINDTSMIHSEDSSWGSVSFVELSNNCLDPAAQFRFRDNGAMLNLKRQGCLAAFYKAGTGYYLDTFYLYVDAVSLDRSACAQKPDQDIYRAINQTTWGGLSVYYKGYERTSFQTWCAVNGHYEPLAENQGVDPYLKLTTSCTDAPDKRFHFGSVKCHGNTTKNANCPKNQYMVVKTASYRGLSATKTCGLSDDYSCEVDVTCLVKKLCDGQHDCNVTVDESVFSVHFCPGFSTYLYFEYQCTDNIQRFADTCVLDVSLSNSSLPNEGFVQIITDNGTKSVCGKSLMNKTSEVVCAQLGYEKVVSLVQMAGPSDNKGTIFSGSIDCNGGEKNLSQCSITTSSESCSELSYIKCKICDRPLLGNKQKFPDLSFNASASSEGHSASDGRISSGSSWCAPVLNDKHYLQVDLGRLYVIKNVAIFGDSTSSKWVTMYNLNYTDNLKNWKAISKDPISGNKNAYNDAAIRTIEGGITTRYLRFIPLSYVGQPCMRIEICGGTLLPGKPLNLTITNIMSRRAEISWQDPQNTGDGDLTRFRIQVMNLSALIHNITTVKVNKYQMVNLTPYTTYEISVAVGNKHGFGEEIISSFTTSEEAPEGPPLNVQVTAESSSSLSVTWEEPEKDKRNGIIINYTVCISREESKPCLNKNTTEKKMLVIKYLNASTKYYVRVLASTEVGRGNYSESKGKFTNGKNLLKPTNQTKSTLSFTLQTPLRNFTHFYVVALKLKDGKEPTSSPDNYNNSELVTYAEAKKSTNPKPYIAAVIKSKNENMFILGDGRNTSNATSRRRRSTSSDYYNGPLDPGTSYSIFQRVFMEGGDDYYSTGWSPASETAKEEQKQEQGTSDDQINVPVIAGAVAGGCVVLLLVILVVIMFSRRKDKQHLELDYEHKQVDKRSDNAVKNEAFLASYDSVELEQNANDSVDGLDDQRRVNDDDRVEEEIENKTLSVPDDTYGNIESINARVHDPIPVKEFSNHMNHLRREDNKQFKLDFADLPTNQMSNWDIAKQPFNIPKNRYGNAITYNHSRVMLSGDEKTDYINASFIDGLTEKYYIATQGPKPKTVNDFWRMIFEHKCPTIVMLTTLKEMGKTKCEKYWPYETGIYGEIKVTATKTKTFADYVTRIFILEKDNERHGVQQFHFKSWPDYGVPLYPTQILTFRRHFKSFHKTKTGPAVIHCSAGVGRTGVFITVDKILDDLDEEKKDTIDIFGFVKDMRTRRVNMVQTSDQYVFIHDAIVDHIKCGANEVEATQVITEIRKLSKKNKEGETGFEEKFKRLNEVSPQLTKQQCEAGLMDENRKKNRNSEIYPTESSRPYLSHIENVENSDYINASYVDGYLGKRYFIATQTPLEKTINDFWRMVFQHNSSTIVLLNQLREDDKEYPMFWPTARAKPQSFGATTVMLDSFYKKENIVIRKFIVSSSADLRDGRMVRMIHYMSWPDHGVTANVDDILKVLSEVEDSQMAMEGQKGPVTVVCSDGAGRSGTYIAISNLVDRVKVVQVIDVFQCIKLIRSKRPQFVETAAQFKMCYDAVTSVLKSFQEYSNFTTGQ